MESKETKLKAKREPPKLHFRLAREEDAQQLFEIVNEAYSVEVGTTGLAFKDTNRYLSVDYVISDINCKKGPFYFA